MVLETTIVPRPPYSLALSTRLKSDATRVFREGVLTRVFEAEGRQALAARTLEARLLRRAAGRHGDLRLPPTRATFGPLSATELGRQGLVARKANALVRLSREWDVERLRAGEWAGLASVYLLSGGRLGPTGRRG